ncbi:alpha/beta hydrolase family esterase [Spirillospora albida]|uniref:alpha/beta hydrolase family esterase n=1 Tax=Spirillospora albida TaxID=58123 RepID=UPI00068D7BD5|nr:hypothetical protein [Spirillospora albida]
MHILSWRRCRAFVAISLAIGFAQVPSAAHADGPPPDRITVSVEGEPAYRLDGDLTSGGIVIADDIVDFATKRIEGQGSLRGADGGTATVNIKVGKALVGMAGTFVLRDPSADVRIWALVHGDVTAPVDGTVVWRGAADVRRGSESARRTVRITIQDRTLDPGDHAIRIEHAGQDRRALVTLPDGYDGSPLPVLFHLPGLIETPWMAELFGRMSQYSRTRGFIMVTAEHYGLGWQVGADVPRDPDVDDPGFINRLQDILISRFNADPKRLYASGLSNGGFFTSRLACENRRFAAYAPVAGQLQDEASCRPGRHVPIVLIHGTTDPLVEYETAPEAAGFFASNNGCGAATDVTDLPDIDPGDRTTVTRHTYRNCRADAPVVLYEIKNGGHQWPGGTPFPLPFLGATTQDIDANAVIWDFVSRFRLP